MYKDAQGLPINVVVMMIIGLVLFTLGMTLFFQIYDSGEEMVNRMNNDIRTDITARECDGDHWLCAPSFTLPPGDGQSFRLQLTNQDDSDATFTLAFDDDNYRSLSNGFAIEQACGSIEVTPATKPVTLEPGASAWFPMYVEMTELKDQPCSFVFTAELQRSGSGVETRAITINIDE